MLFQFLNYFFGVITIGLIYAFVEKWWWHFYYYKYYFFINKILSNWVVGAKNELMWRCPNSKVVVLGSKYPCYGGLAFVIQTHLIKLKLLGYSFKNEKELNYFFMTIYALLFEFFLSCKKILFVSVAWFFFLVSWKFIFLFNFNLTTFQTFEVFSILTNLDPLTAVINSVSHKGVNILNWFLTNYQLWSFNYPLSMLSITLVEDRVFEIPFGLDGLNIFFIVLTTLFLFLCSLAISNTKDFRTVKLLNVYISCFFILTLFLLLVFTILDLFFFYICFEAILIPMFLLIGIGGFYYRKILASYYLVLYTIFGSLFLLLGMGFLWFDFGTLHINMLYTFYCSEWKQLLLWPLFFIAFSIKIPMVPFHLWLPEAHVEAPTTGSVVLASLLLKMGGYGLIRFLIFFLAHGTVYFLPIVYMLLLISIVYASFTTLIQIDIKRIIAYSSVAHMNFALLGLFALTEYGITGSILIMISHGLISGALFFLIGMVYERFHSRLIFYYSGLSQRLPLFTFYFLFFIFSNMSLPGCASFAGEFLTIIGLCQKNLYLGILSLIGVFLCTAYSVWLLNRICYGTFKLNYWVSSLILKDLIFFELVILLILVLFSLIMGVFPQSITVFFTPQLWLYSYFL